ncbi:MAG: rRNA pseudouridine synthase [Candidatus Hydrogenedentes bacterium]|nr:rRNA pseudouridine synthase [Candidatus Hydrogenedentota bacterium]
MLRLQKYLAECGIASRRAAERLISEGRVSVNGSPATLGLTISPDTDCVAVDGKPIAKDTKIYIVLNKPRDVVTTASDTHGRKTVLDCVKGVKARVYPVGRLDMDVQGALLLTNDGELSHRLLHPSNEVWKVYRAWVRGVMQPDAMHRLEAGVELEDGPTAPARVRILKTEPNASLLELQIHEGRKREVKRMCAAVGHPVKSLLRESFATIRADGLRPGEWRYLSQEEIRHLRALTQLD